MKSFDEVFEQIKHYITEHELISDVACNTWISTMIPVRLDGQNAVFQVDTGFQQGILLNNYKTMLENVMTELMGLAIKGPKSVIAPTPMKIRDGRILHSSIR